MAVGMRNKDIESINRRIGSVAGHLIPAQTRNGNDIAFSNCSSGIDDTYHRVHGQVPPHIPHWKPALDDPAKPFADIIYEKAENIAKVYSF